jgi:hypothetical protein
VFKTIDEADVLAKIAGGKELTDAEGIKFRQLTRAAFRGYEDYAYQHQHGLLDSSEWTGRLENIRGIVAIPLVRDQWLATRHEYSDNLQDVIDPLVSGP